MFSLRGLCLSVLKCTYVMDRPIITTGGTNPVYFATPPVKHAAAPSVQHPASLTAASQPRAMAGSTDDSHPAELMRVWSCDSPVVF